MLLELLQDGLISPSNSPFAAPALLVRKPDGKYRLVIDYRKLNQLTIKDRYALPTAESVFDRFGGAADTLHSKQQYRPSRVFSTLDLRWAYYQIPMDPSSIPFTAFKTPLGSYVWNVMPMGVSNAPAAFQRLMDSIFQDLPFVSAYFDDVCVHSHSAVEHMHHLYIVFQRL
jgi:putative transposase